LKKNSKKIICISLLCIIGLSFGMLYFIKNEKINFENDNNLSLANMEYSYKEHETKKINVNLDNPVGIEVMDDELVVADSSNNQILFIDKKNYKVNKIIGNTGNSEGEFISPQGIAIDDEKNIYVVDSGNRRIQKLTRDGEIDEVINLDVFKNGANDISKLNDIAIDKNHNIYISVLSVYESEAKIYFIDNNRQTKSIGKGFIGYLDSYQGEVYFMSLGEFYKKKDLQGYRSGKNFLLKLKDGTIEKGYYLPKEYTPTSFSIVNDEIFVISKTFRSIDRLDLKGNYIETMYLEGKDENSGSGLQYLIADTDGYIYFTDSIDKCIYELKTSIE